MSETIKATTWNLLAPVYAMPSLFPNESSEILKNGYRSKVIAGRMKEFNSDVYFLQEVQKNMLDEIKQLNPSLADDYTTYYHSYDEVFCSNWFNSNTNNQYVDNGMCILLKKELFNGSDPNSEVEVFYYNLESNSQSNYPYDNLQISEDNKKYINNYIEIAETSKKNFAVIVKCSIPKFENKKFIFACCHSDADNFVLANQQILLLKYKIDEIKRYEASEDTFVIWGGDFNMEEDSYAIKDIRKSEYKSAFEDSVQKQWPSCCGVAGSARIDWIFSSPNLISENSTIPECKLSYCLGNSMVHTALFSTVGSIKESILLKILLVLLLIILFPLTLCFLLFVLIHYCQARARCEWALREIGSDHLPLTTNYHFNELKVV